VLGQLPGELAPAAGVLILELHACRALGVHLGDSTHTFSLESFGDLPRVLLETLPLARHRAIATAGDDQGTRHGGMAQAHV
jgi:hypothetical protein